jgi:hypothetical protein
MQISIRPVSAIIASNCDNTNPVLEKAPGVVCGKGLDAISVI